MDADLHLPLDDHRQRLLLKPAQQLALVLGRPRPQGCAAHGEPFEQERRKGCLVREGGAGEEGEDDETTVLTEEGDVLRKGGGVSGSLVSHSCVVRTLFQ